MDHVDGDYLLGSDIFLFSLGEELKGCMPWIPKDPNPDIFSLWLDVELIRGFVNTLAWLMTLLSKSSFKEIKQSLSVSIKFVNDWLSQLRYTIFILGCVAISLMIHCKLECCGFAFIRSLSLPYNLKKTVKSIMPIKNLQLYTSWLSKSRSYFWE